MTMFGVRILNCNGMPRPSSCGSLLGFCDRGDWSHLIVWTASTIEEAEAKAGEMRASQDRCTGGRRCIDLACALPFAPECPAIDGALAVAIDAEAAAWASFFDVTDEAGIESRRQVMRANAHARRIPRPARPGPAGPLWQRRKDREERRQRRASLDRCRRQRP